MYFLTANKNVRRKDAEDVQSICAQETMGNHTQWTWMKSAVAKNKIYINCLYVEWKTISLYNEKLF